VKLAVLAVTAAGLQTARRIATLFPGAELYTSPGLLAERPEMPDAGCSPQPFPQDLGTFTGTLFSRVDALVFVAAVGIAVRMIAPYLQDKARDPAVVAVDDTGHFAVSLLAGHLGGANRLAEKLAAELGGTAVITTATDRRGLVAYDLLAAKLRGKVERLGEMKKISMAQLAGKPVAVYADTGIHLELPGEDLLVRSEAELREQARYGAVWISSRQNPPSLPPEVPLAIIRPPTLTAGLGCRRGVPAAEIVEAVEQALERCERSPYSLTQLVSLQLKADEPGLRQAGEKLGVPVRFFDLETVRSVAHRFPGSSFVQEAVGTGAVAEPCAYLGSGRGTIICRKQVWEKTTVALAESALFCQLNGGYRK